MSLKKKLLIAYKNKTLIKKVKKKINPYYQGLIYKFISKSNDNIKIHSPKLIQTSDKDLDITTRIYKSYKKMKDDEPKASNLFRPSKMWQEHINKDYKILNESLQKDDLSKFSFFLSNFGNWENSLGIENNILVKKFEKNYFLKEYLINVLFGKQLKLWKYFNNEKKNISNLNLPTHGNQVGAYIDKNFVVVGSFFSEIYGSFLNNLISKKERPIVADLGAGYGKLAFYTLNKRKNFCFLDFDLPETLCLAAYFLMKTWPNKKTLLYGEEKYSIEKNNIYDLIFMPSYEITKLQENSIDLFINKNSLGEMTSDVVRNYLQYICKSTKYFLHMNHDINRNKFDDGAEGLLGHEYPIDAKKFDLIFKYPDLGNLTYFDGTLDLESDIFVYLYKKI